jgi:hypothetical protein
VPVLCEQTGRLLPKRGKQGVPGQLEILLRRSAIANGDIGIGGSEASQERVALCALKV